MVECLGLQTAGIFHQPWTWRIGVSYRNQKEKLYCERTSYRSWDFQWRDAAVPGWINRKVAGVNEHRSLFFLLSSWSLSRVTSWSNTAGKQYIHHFTGAVYTIQPLDAQNRRERLEKSSKGANTAPRLSLWSPMWSGHDGSHHFHCMPFLIT